MSLQVCTNSSSLDTVLLKSAVLNINFICKVKQHTEALKLNCFHFKYMEVVRDKLISARQNYMSLPFKQF